MGQRNTLSAILAAGNLGYDLHGNVAGRGKAVGLVNKCFTDHRTILQHVLQIDQVTVVHMLGKIVRIMEMNQPFRVRLYNVLRKQQTSGQIPADLPCHIIPLYTVDDRILIGIFLHHFFIITFYQCQYTPVRGIALADKRSCIPVSHITSGYIESALGHNLVLNHVLHLFHGNRTVHTAAFKINILRYCLHEVRLMRIHNRIQKPQKLIAFISLFPIIYFV